MLSLDRMKINFFRYIPVEGGRNLKDRIFATEITETRQLIDQLNWLATETRSYHSYDVIELSSMLKQENVECFFFYVNSDNIKIFCKTDNSCVNDSVHSSG